MVELTIGQAASAHVGTDNQMHSLSDSYRSQTPLKKEIVIMQMTKREANLLSGKLVARGKGQSRRGLARKARSTTTLRHGRGASGKNWGDVDNHLHFIKNNW